MRKPGSLIIKDPISDEPQGFDWTAWLAELGVGVVIGVSTWAIYAADGVTASDGVLTKHDDTIVSGALKTQSFFAAGTRGKKYTITNHVETNSSPPAKDDRSFQYLVQNR